MAVRESMADALIRVSDGVDLDPWQELLGDAAERGVFLTQAPRLRPLTRVVRVEPGARRVVYEGWRAAEIARCIDECVSTIGELGLVERRDRNGTRLVRAYQAADGAERAFRARHRERLNAASKERVRVWRAAQGADYAAYVDAYRAKFPGTEPVGFSRWLVHTRRVWRGQGAAGIQVNDVSGAMRRQISEQVAARGRS